MSFLISLLPKDLPGAVARSDARPPGMRTVAGSIFGQDSVVEIGHENKNQKQIISTAILSLPLIQVRQ